MPKTSRPQPLPLVSVLTFAIPSLLGAFLFIFPMPVGDKFYVPITWVAQAVQKSIAAYIPDVLVLFAAVNAVLSLVGYCGQRLRIAAIENKMPKIFVPDTLGLCLRLFAIVVFICARFHIGPEALSSDRTGGLLLAELLPILLCVFLFAGFFMPLLVDFGLLDFTATLFTRFMRPIFKLPGRAAVDCMASWVGDGSIGILITTKQFEQGFYTGKESAIISTMFSFVSITFSLVVLSYAKLDHLVGPYFLTITFAGLVAAVICPRLYPLCSKPDTAFGGVIPPPEDLPPRGMLFSESLRRAVKVAEVQRIPHLLSNSCKNVLEMWFAVIPVVMALGTLALMVAEFTPVFRWLGAPFVPLISFFGVADAEIISQSLVVGFADMLLPIVIAGDGLSETTRFIVATLSVTQLVYMSEVGALLLASKIPLNIFDLLLIFLQRTLITFPIIVFVAKFWIDTAN